MKGNVIVKSGIRPSGSATAGLTLGRGGCEVYLGIHVLCEERRLVNLKIFGGRRLTESSGRGEGPGESRAGTKGHLEGQRHDLWGQHAAASGMKDHQVSPTGCTGALCPPPAALWWERRICHVWHS